MHSRIDPIPPKFRGGDNVLDSRLRKLYLHNVDGECPLCGLRVHHLHDFRLIKPDVFTVTLFDPEMKTYDFSFIAKNVTEAVTKAMDEAFRQMPDNKFALAGVKGDEKKMQEYFDAE